MPVFEDYQNDSAQDDDCSDIHEVNSFMKDNNECTSSFKTSLLPEIYLKSFKMSDSKNLIQDDKTIIEYNSKSSGASYAVSPHDSDQDGPVSKSTIQNAQKVQDHSSESDSPKKKPPQTTI